MIYFKMCITPIFSIYFYTCYLYWLIVKTVLNKLLRIYNFSLYCFIIQNVPEEKIRFYRAGYVVKIKDLEVYGLIYKWTRLVTHPVSKQNKKINYIQLTSNYVCFVHGDYIIWLLWTCCARLEEIGLKILKILQPCGSLRNALNRSNKLYKRTCAPRILSYRLI